MTSGFADLDGLPRDQLLAVAHDYMLTGMLTGRSLGPINALGGEVPDTESLPIDQWMGASPVYTHRLRELMGIEGHDVAAIMKALQLDVGFVHGYMDVAYRIDSPEYGEFWLLHCGALIDVEPLGEDRVVNMCHTIEDPTFDATALATNPRARIRPIHRPPRIPADRHPHCHWTLKIDDANEPIGPMVHTDRVAALPLASVPNAVGPDRDGGELHDYRGGFEPDFRLRRLTSGALAAVTREFQIQSHLLCASDHLTVADRAGESVARATSDEGWRTFAWLLAGRLARAIDLGEGIDAVVRALELTPAVPPGFDRTVVRDGDVLGATFTASHDGVLDAGHPGWCGSLARGATTAVEGTLGALGFTATTIEAAVGGSSVTFEATLVPRTADEPVPDLVQLALDLGHVASWDFGQLVEIPQLMDDGLFLPEPSPREVRYTVISVDDHVVEPAHTFEGRLPKRLQDRAPQIVENSKGHQVWEFEGGRYSQVGMNAVAGRRPETVSVEPFRFEQMRLGCFDADARVADMDINGVWASLNFPSQISGFCGRVFFAADDQELGDACVRAWNDWLFEEWYEPHPDRIVPLGIAHLGDPRRAVAEIERNAERGFKAVALPERPHAVGLPSLWDREHWDPIIAACERTQTVICLHVGSSGIVELPPGGPAMQIAATLFGQLSLQACTEWLWSGYAITNPDVRIAMSEGGIGWVAMLLDRLDNVVDRSGYGLGWADRPSDVLRRNFWFCTIDDPSTIDTRHRIGVENIMVETDYPHGDGTWPDTQSVIEQLWGHIPPAELRAMCCENAAALFRHPLPEEVLPADG